MFRFLTNKWQLRVHKLFQLSTTHFAQKGMLNEIREINVLLLQRLRFIIGQSKAS
jgi:hypothetical protein